ncbi:MAG: DUF3237 family protein [Clostridia bacterium]|nr:DUF3237 family protein [Clostridia bacterium]
MENKPAALALVTRLHVTLSPSVAVGDTPRGALQIIPMTGGTAEGPEFTGRVCPGGAVDIAFWRVVG